MIAQSIYRWENRLQAGVSLLDTPESLCRENIRDRDFTFCYILSGTGSYTDAEGRRFRYGPGSFLLRLPGVLHHQVHDAGSCYCDQYFVLPREFAALLLDRKCCSPERPVVDCGIRPSVSAQFARLTAELEHSPEDRLILVATELFRTIGELLLSATVEDPRHAAVMAGAELLTRDEARPVPEIARSCGMGYSTYRRLFAERLGCSPEEYRIRKRIERIQSLLRSTALTQKEIAERFGYADVYTFHRQFKRHTGMTPNEFRKK